jgi:hypothetical protein
LFLVLYKPAAQPPTTTLSGKAAVKLKNHKNLRPEGPSTLTPEGRVISPFPSALLCDTIKLSYRAFRSPGGYYMAEEQQNQDLYRIDLMRTLWENTYRGTIFNYKEQYVATVRLIFSIPLDRSEVPENAPEVNPVIIVLVEDTTLSPLEIVDFEQAMTPILAKRLASEYFQPDRIMYFYPSPADGAETKDKK